jgi:hypothetical protein
MMDKKRWWSDGSDVLRYDTDYEHEDWIEVQVAPLDAVVAERGSWLWAMEMMREGKRITHKGATIAHLMADVLDHPAATEWVELPAPWVPKAGERVRWTLGRDTGTGTYLQPFPDDETWPHSVYIGELPVCVDSVSRLEEP